MRRWAWWSVTRFAIALCVGFKVGFQCRMERAWDRPRVNDLPTTILSIEAELLAEARACYHNDPGTLIVLENLQRFGSSPTTLVADLDWLDELVWEALNGDRI